MGDPIVLGLTLSSKPFIKRNMFGIGGQELFLILILALIILGPKKLPEVARYLGKAIGEFQRTAEEIKQEIDISADLKDSHSASSDTDTPNESSEDTEADAEENDADKSVNKEKDGAYNPDEIED